MDSSAILALLVGIIAAAMVVIAISAMMFVMSFRKYCDHLQASLNQITSDVQPVLQSAREILTEGREKINAISTNVLEITGIVRGQVVRLDSVLSEASERARLQFIRLDQLLTDTVSRVEETGEAVRQTVLAPVREISAILSGVRTTLDFLFRRNKAGVEHATQDEELFI